MNGINVTSNYLIQKQGNSPFESILDQKSKQYDESHYQSPFMNPLDDDDQMSEEDTNVKENTVTQKCSLYFGQAIKQNLFLEQSQNPKTGDGMSEYDQGMCNEINDVEFEQKQKDIIVESTNQQDQKSQGFNQSPSKTDIEKDVNNFRLALVRKKTLGSKNINLSKEQISPFKVNDSVKRELSNIGDGENSDVQIGLINFIKKKQDALNNQFKIILRTINIKKFMNIMRGKSRRLLFRYISPVHFSIIDDYASDYNFFFYNQFFYSSVNKLYTNSNYINIQQNHFTNISFQQIDSNKTRVVQVLVQMQFHIKLQFLSYQLTYFYFIEETCLGELWYNPKIVFHPVKFFGMIIYLFIQAKQFHNQKDSIIKIIWDILFILLMINMIIYLPLHNSFSIGSNFQNFICFQLVNVIFPLEILLNLNTAIFKKGLIITRRRDIIKDYLHKKFMLILFLINLFYNFYMINKLNRRDFLIMLVFMLNDRSTKFKYLDYVVYLRVIDILKKYSELAERFQRNNKVSISAKIVKLVFIMVVVAHLSACCFVEIGQIERHSGLVNWLDVSTKQSDTWVDIYITGIYWAAITMVTLGYGDVVPITSGIYFTALNQILIERVFVIAMSLSSCGIFAYSFNQIGEIIQDMQKSQAEFKSKMKQLNYLMSKRGIEKQLQTKIRKFYEYYYEEKFDSDLDINIIIENLTTLLKEEVFRDLYGKKLRQHKIFSLNFSNEVLDALALRMKEQKFVAEEYFYLFNQISDPFVKYLKKGEVELVSNENGKTYTLLKRYTQEEVIGEEEFFHNSRRRQYSLKACNKSIVAYLTKDDFSEVLKNFPSEYEFYRQLKDKISLYNQHQTLGLKCIICDKFTHKFDNCPYLHIDLRRNLVIENSKKTEEQVRVKIKRFQQRYNSRNNQAVVQNVANSSEFHYESRLNLRSDSDMSETYEQPSKINPSYIENIPQSSQANNNIYLHEPQGSFCNVKVTDLSSYRDNASQMDKTDRDDIFSQVSIRGNQAQQNQQQQQSSQSSQPQLQQNNQPQIQQLSVDYKVDIPHSRKRNSEYINQIKTPIQGAQFQRFQSIGNQQVNQIQNIPILPNPPTPTNNQNSVQQQLMSINVESHISQKLTRQSGQSGSFSELEHGVASYTNFQRKEDKRKSTVLKKATILLQAQQQKQLEENISSGLSSNNNQLQVHRQGSRNMSVKFNDHKNSFHERSQASQIQNALMLLPRYCLFDIEAIFDIAKEFEKYFSNNNLTHVLKIFNLNQQRNRSKSKNINIKKGKKKGISPNIKNKKARKSSFRIFQSPQDQ